MPGWTWSPSTRPPSARPSATTPTSVRNVCLGSAAAGARFFAQIAKKDLLAPGGAVYVIASNTADLRALVEHALATTGSALGSITSTTGVTAY
ncbi:hypothetical protein SVIOM342S_09031 [Streptomyces violaceorubidus]